MNNHPALIAAGFDQFCDIIDVTKDTDEKAWLAARAGGLGASAAGAALGLSPYMSQMELHLIKTGQLNPEDISDKEAVYWGTVLEEPIARRYAEKTGREVINPECMYVCRAHPELRVNPDRFDIDEHGRLGLVEIKNTDAHLWEDWMDDGSPPWNQAQVALQSYVTRVYRGRLVALVGGNRMVIREVDIDEEFVGAIAERLIDWWDRHVVQGAMPPVDGSNSCTTALKKLWKANGATINLPKEAMGFIRTYKAAHAEMKRLEEVKAEAGNELRAILGPNSVGTWRNVPVVSNNEGSTTKLDVKAHGLAEPACHAANSKTTVGRTLRVSDSKAAKAVREEAA